ncbi:MAG: hypothetical protein HY928_18430 [Elusimicrobia bacterium]|nr:hypothetical protein [Elusimicrobiota bacterium]
MSLSAALLAVLCTVPVRAQVRVRAVPLSAPAAPPLFAPSLPAFSAPGAGLPVPAPVSVGLPAPTVPAVAKPFLDRRLGPLVERRGVGLLVVDLKDSTRLYQEAGSRQGQRLTEAVLDFAAVTAQGLGGAVARRLGDGLLIAFDGAAEATAAGLAVQAAMPEVAARLGRPGLALRAAVHAGRVVEDRSGGGFDVYGQAVERALSLAAVGRAGTVVREAPGGGPLELVPEPAAPRGDGWTQAELSRTAIETRATLFADLADWPARYEAGGRRSAVAATKAFHAFAAAVVRRRGGELVKTSGEAVMASFPGAAAALLAAAELQNRSAEFREAVPLAADAAVRVGVSYGRVVRRTHLSWSDYFGNTVNAAARLMRRAGGGGILVSARALQDPEAGRLLEAARVERGRMELKGFAEPVEVLRLEAASVRTGRGGSMAKRLKAVARAVLRMLPRPDDGARP